MDKQVKNIKRWFPTRMPLRTQFGKGQGLNFKTIWHFVMFYHVVG